MVKISHSARENLCCYRKNGFRQNFNYRSGLWLLWSPIILSQTCSKLRNESIEDNEVDNRLEKIDFDDPAKDAMSVAAFSPSREFRVKRNAVALTRPGFRDEFLQDIAGISEVETSVSGKDECFLAIDEVKKISFL